MPLKSVVISCPLPGTVLDPRLNLWTTRASLHCRGAKFASSKCVSLAWGLSGAGSWEIKDSGSFSFYLLLNYLKDFRWGACTMQTATTEDKFFLRRKDLHGLANIRLPNLCSFLLPMNCLPPLRSPRSLTPQLSVCGSHVLTEPLYCM